MRTTEAGPGPAARLSARRCEKFATTSVRAGSEPLRTDFAGAFLPTANKLVRRRFRPSPYAALTKKNDCGRIFFYIAFATAPIIIAAVRSINLPV